MNIKHDVHALCLEVFAGLSAIVTHDLKNTLAIINENAGLLDDLALMAEEDLGVPTERVKGAAAKIAQQVTRSNTIIKNLNRFAHSGDTPVAREAVGDILNLMVAMTGRKAAMRNIAVTVESGEGHIVEASLFHLEALVYLILVRLYAGVAVGGSVSLSSVKDSSDLLIHFRSDFQGEGGMESFPDSKEQALLAYLGGSLDVEGESLVLKISARAAG